MVGEIAMYCFVILLATGIYLALFYYAVRHRRRLPRAL